jgi:hypothetical protein
VQEVAKTSGQGWFTADGEINIQHPSRKEEVFVDRAPVAPREGAAGAGRIEPRQKTAGQAGDTRLFRLSLKKKIAECDSVCPILTNKRSSTR